MPKPISKSEKIFREKFPNARLRVRRSPPGERGVRIYEVLVGDYHCAEHWHGPVHAYTLALRYLADGLITPDPNELAHAKRKHGKCPVCGHYGNDCTGVETRDAAQHRRVEPLLVRAQRLQQQLRDAIQKLNQATGCEVCASDDLSMMTTDDFIEENGQ